ncbi:MAG: zinc-binding dehydrogenase, partial [Limnohabitans sp.]
DAVSQVKLLSDGEGADTIIDMDFSTTIQWMAQGILRPHGHLVCYGSNPPPEISVSFRPLLFNSYTLRFFLIYELNQEQRMACLNELNTMLQQNELTHAIGATFSLEQVVQAHETVEAGKTIGNVVIDIAH